MRIYCCYSAPHFEPHPHPLIKPTSRENQRWKHTEIGLGSEGQMPVDALMIWFSGLNSQKTGICQRSRSPTPPKVTLQVNNRSNLWWVQLNCILSCSLNQSRTLQDPLATCTCTAQLQIPSSKPRRSFLLCGVCSHTSRFRKVAAKPIPAGNGRFPRKMWADTSPLAQSGG